MMVYLTGGIGTGKSTVLSMFAELGATTVRADDIVHAILARPEVQSLVAERLHVVDASDRAAIASRVFTDAQALRELESIIHPLVAQEFALIRQSITDSQCLVYEIPLPPRAEPGEQVVVVEAPLSLRKQRLLERGLAPTDLEARIAAQVDESEYRRVATQVIVNDGSRAQLRERVQQVWEVLQHDTGHL